MSDYLSSLGYPFRGRPMVFVFSVMMVWGVFLAARDVLIGWIAAFCFLLPFMCAFFMKMVRQSAMGEEDICPFPELDEWLDSLMLPFVRLVVCIIVSFLPFAVYAHTAAWAADTTLAWLFLAAGVIYFPGVFMRTSVRERFSGLSPVGWWGLVRRAPFSYAGLLGCHMRRGMDHPEPSFRAFDGFRHGAREAVCRLRVDEYVRDWFMLKHEFAGEEEDGSFSPSGPAAS